ncbi:hypothetical protein DAEQUDRAFT_600081 [Daedalea quercina L-15889]|uniref:Uncharacterized protein n=1 Tax=Daedalea quercina L-15889 TaxID=1314783 RepID=A0A165LNI4_9APHY|nr:hypothetical protein DAEQUDRAFT_600081 [Daedalea quercina L-15889]
MTEFNRMHAGLCRCEFHGPVGSRGRAGLYSESGMEHQPRVTRHPWCELAAGSPGIYKTKHRAATLRRLVEQLPWCTIANASPRPSIMLSPEPLEYIIYHPHLVYLIDMATGDSKRTLSGLLRDALRDRMGTSDSRRTSIRTLYFTSRTDWPLILPPHSMA